MAICSFLVLAVFAFRSQLMEIMAPTSYEDAGSIVGWVAMSQLFLAAYWVFAIGPLHSRNTSQLAWIALSSAGMNVLLNFLLIPSIGILGAAIATFASYGMLAALTYRAAKHTLDLKLDWARLGKLTLASGAILLIILTAEFAVHELWLEMLIKALGLVCLPILLLLVKFISPAQLKNFLGLIKHRFDSRLATKTNP